MKFIGRISCILDVIFYPFEQIAWFAERKIIDVNPGPWDDASTVCWVLSLYLGLMRWVSSNKFSLWNVLESYLFPSFYVFACIHLKQNAQKPRSLFTRK